MNKTCKQCQQQFEITDEDLQFYDKVSPMIAGIKQALPPPQLCPPCRLQRRMSFRNERKLYNRKCDFSGRQIISIFSADKPYKVYESSIWWSDKFDAKEFGRDFDFSRPFFEQFRELQLAVPRIALFGKGNENSEYTNHADQLKNCYLVLNGGLAENCYYCNWIVKDKDCIDCSFIQDCELCYQTIYSNNCYNSRFLSHCEQCHDAAFLYDCKGVSNSMMCVGLRNKEYCILNTQYTKEEYQEKIKNFEIGSWGEQQKLLGEFHQLLMKSPHRAAFINNCEDCSGQNISTSKNCHQCFYLQGSQDCKYCYDSLDLVDSYDVYETGMNCELQIETHACNRSKNTVFSSACYDNFNVWYSDLCHNSQNLFGCIGLKKDQYCILNKQYSKAEYEALLKKIIEHMKTTGEWGEFFPITLSPFGYNETQAIETFPLEKAEVLKNTWQWRDLDQGNAYQGEVVVIPDNITDISDEILDKILTCDTCHKHYRVIRQELNFYREHGIPVPHFCIECRHKERIKESTEITLYHRTCAKGKETIETTFAPNRPEIVYCEKCYLETVY